MRTMLRVAAIAAVMFAGLAATPAGAYHDRIYRACSAPWGFVHMTQDEWNTEMLVMEADGTIPPGVVRRYHEAEHDTGKGTNVQEDGTIPTWDQWARGLVDGQILAIDDWANGDHPEIEQLMFDSGRVPEWMMDMGGVVRRFDDPYWGQSNPMNPTNTIWQSICWGNYGTGPSIPVNELVDGEWVSNIPATTTTTSTTTSTTTTVVPATTTTTTTTAPATTTTTVVPATTTTTTVPATTTTTTTLALQGYELPDGYDLWDAEYDGWPFEQTILALEARYPPGTPGKKHFPLSAAVRFLRLGGKVGGLDFVWGSGA